VESNSDRLRIQSHCVAYNFDSEAVPIIWVPAPSHLTVETRDAYDGTADDLNIQSYIERRVPGRMNPCTGPIGITDAEPGDTVQVTIDSIRVAPRGYVAAVPGIGILGDRAIVPSVEAFDVEGGDVYVAGGMRLPARPMVGTIGVAPASGAIATLSLGDHGGNLDFNEITTGTTVYLPVRVPGALFGVGDVHVTMGDGEAHSGVNIAAEIDLAVGVIPGENLDLPWFETDSHVMTVGVADDLGSAVRQAVDSMERRLILGHQVAPTMARILSGAVTDVRLGQAGGYGVPVSAYARFPKSALASADM